MKGVVALCLKNLVESKFGREKWRLILDNAGLNNRSVFLVTSDIDNSALLRIVESTCKVLEITIEQVADAFGEHWVNVYSQKMFAGFYTRFNSAQEFLSSMNMIHQMASQLIVDSKPPRFDIIRVNDTTIEMKYSSDAYSGELCHPFRLYPATLTQ